MQVGLLSKVCSFSKLIRMICVILSFQIGCTLVGVSICKSLTFIAASQMGIMFVKKSAFYNLDRCFAISVTIRANSIKSNANSLWTTIIEGVKTTIISTFSCFCVHINRHRAGIALISPTHLEILLNGMLATYSISLSVKRINPSAAMLGLEFLTCALLLMQL